MKGRERRIANQATRLVLAMIKTYGRKDHYRLLLDEGVMIEVHTNGHRDAEVPSDD